MLLKPLALAAAATAFVLIPEMSKHDENIFKTLPIADGNDAMALGIPESAFERSISVPCNECKGGKTELQLDFAVEDDSRLLLNDFELYPNADPWSGDLQAAVTKGHHGPKNKRLGYSLAVYPKAMSKEDNMELIEVDLKIIEVGSRFVEGIPTVKVDLIKAPGGSVLMSSVEFDHPVEPVCTTIWCQAKELADKLWAQAQRIKGCGKRPTQDPAAESMDDSEVPEFSVPDMEYVPMIDEPEMPPHEEWHQLVKSLAAHIIMPVIMGMATGFAVAFIALCIHAFARRLVRLARGKRDGEFSEPSKATQNEVATVEEKAGLMA